MASKSCSPVTQKRADLSIPHLSSSPLLRVNNHSPSSTKSCLPSAPTEAGTPLPLWRCPPSSITILRRTELDQSEAKPGSPSAAAVTASLPCRWGRSEAANAEQQQICSCPPFGLKNTSPSLSLPLQVCEKSEETAANTRGCLTEKFMASGG